MPFLTALHRFSNMQNRAHLLHDTATWAIAAFLFAVAGLQHFSAFSAEPANRPNIVLILADDLGYSDLGCYGGEIRTPHLDALARDGLRFTQFYNCTRCCPSRASLLTGLYPHQAGVGSMNTDDGPPGYRGSLQPNCVTIAQVLKSAGYRTAMAGKWHVGENISPIDRGFDDFYGWTKGYGVNSWYAQTMIRLPAGRSQRTYKSGEFFATDALTDHAIDFVGEMRKPEAPWFLYLAYQAPHFPLHAKDEDVATYADRYRAGWDKIREERLARQKQLGLVSAATSLTPRSAIPHPVAAARIGSATSDGDNPAWDSLPADRQYDLSMRMAVYAAMVTAMDRNIGRLIDDLRTSGQLNNTLILFLSDNGACAEWEPFGFDLSPIDPTQIQPGVGVNLGTQAAPNILHNADHARTMWHADGMISYGSAWANASNTPWRLYKHYAHEGGIGTPLIAHWPAGIAARGELRTQLGHLIDIMATCVDVGKATYPRAVNGHEITPMEGASLVPALANKSVDRDFLAWEHEGNAAIRSGDWKLVRMGGAGKWELYDLARDRAELHNLADQQPQRVQELAAKWQQWAQRTHVFPKPGGQGAKGAKKK
jgi:arylsulfatase A-like enzyme